MASLGCSDRLFSCTCHRPLSLTRSRPRLRHPPYRTIKFKFCAGPPGQPLHANASDQEQAVDAVAAMDEPVASSVPRSEEWELDFSSRPLVDERGKKVWELLICSPDRSFEYSEYFPNNKINSKEVRPLGSSTRDRRCLCQRLPSPWIPLPGFRSVLDCGIIFKDTSIHLDSSRVAPSKYNGIIRRPHLIENA